MADLILEEIITANVRDALNGDEEACKRLNLLLQFPFSSIKKLYGTSEEDYYALNIIAILKFKMFNDKAALRFLTSAKNPLKDVFSPLIGLIKL